MSTVRSAWRHSVIAPVLLSGALLMLGSSVLLAQPDRTNVQGMGMARTAVISSRGLDAVGINPANLAFSDGNTVTVSLFPLSVNAGSNFLDYDLYTTYFTGVATDSGRVGKFLSESDKDRILNAFPGGVGTIFADFEVRLFGIGVETRDIGNFAFTITEHADAFARIPRDYADFVLHGNPPGSVRDFNGSDVKASWTREYTLAYGRELQRLKFTKSLEVGVGVRLIEGYGYFGIENFNTSVATSPNGVLTGTVHYASKTAGVDFIQDKNSGSGYNPFPTPAGVGYGIDLGASAHVTDFIYAGISLTDIGSIRWTENAIENSIDTVMVVDDPVGTGQQDALNRTLRGKKKTVDGFYSTLPTQLRIGAALQIDKWPGNQQFPGELLVELDYTQGFTNTPGSTSAPRFSLGVEYLPLSWLPIRTGLSAGGTDRFNVAFGFGLHSGVFDFDLATENVTVLLAPRSTSNVSLALGMKLKF